MASPENDIQWGETADPGDLSDPDPKRPGGYQYEDPFPSKEFNQMSRTIGRWVAKGFATLADFISVATAGQIAPVATFDPATDAPYTQKTAVAVAGVVSVDGDGEYWLALDAAVATLRLYDTLAVVTTYTPTGTIGTGTVRAVMNGTYVAMIYGQFLEVFDQATGTSLWKLDQGAALTDVALDGVNVYIVGITTANVSLRALTLLDGTFLFTWDHDATLFSVCTDGLRVYAGGNSAGAAGDSTTGVHIVALNTSDGSLYWEKTDAAVSVGQGMYTDGTELLVAISGGGGGVRIMATSNGGITNTSSLSSVVAVMLDPEYLYLGTAIGVYVAPRARGLEATAVVYGTPDVLSLYSDGETLIVIDDLATDEIQTYFRPDNKIRRWYRADGDELFLPYRQKAFPME